MTRDVPEWVGKTSDSRPPSRVMLRIFERYSGTCHWSGRKIRPGDKWDCDHIIALANGGENRESNLAPIMRGKEHKEKTAKDVAEKARNYRKRANHLGLKQSKSRIQSRGFPKSEPQRTASRPVERRR